MSRIMSCRIYAMNLDFAVLLYLRSSTNSKGSREDDGPQPQYKISCRHGMHGWITSPNPCGELAACVQYFGECHRREVRFSGLKPCSLVLNIHSYGE